MTEWENPPTDIQTPEGVIDWLRTNIAAITINTTLSVKMRDDVPTNVELLEVDLALSAPDITAIETQFPSLVGKIIP